MTDEHPKTATCELCGREFQFQPPKRGFWPRTCAACRGKRKNVCGWCGQTFVGDRRARFCSRDHANRANGERRREASRLPSAPVSAPAEDQDNEAALWAWLVGDGPVPSQDVFARADARREAEISPADREALRTRREAYFATRTATLDGAPIDLETVARLQGEGRARLVGVMNGRFAYRSKQQLDAMRGQVVSAGDVD